LTGGLSIKFSRIAVLARKAKVESGNPVRPSGGEGSGVG
jgi:hypothetical protein